MPLDPNAEIEVVGFEWVPPFARGNVRDIRVRWALEELGLPYRSRLISAMNRPEGYYKEQPFGQVPAFNEGDLHMFESGAVVLYLAERSETLLPKAGPKRAEVLQWLVCALNSIEPQIMQLQQVDIFNKDQEWANLRRPSLTEMANKRLEQLSGWLGEKDWFAGEFSAADIIMVCALRITRMTSVTLPANLVAYLERGMARPAYQQAIADQAADFLPDPEEVPA